MAKLLSTKLTTLQLAVELNRSPETLVRWRRLRCGPPFVRMQGRVLYDRNDVERWLDAQRVDRQAA